MNLYPITVVNDFYESPDEIRRFALTQKFQYCKAPEEKYGWPGCRTKDISILDNSLYQKVCSKIISLFHNFEHDLMRWEITTSFQLVSKRFEKGLIHKDGNVVFAGIIYLSPNAPLDSGTSIYRQNNLFDEQRYSKALDQNDFMLTRGKNPSFDYHDMFEETIRVNNVYNSLILFEGDQYHAANNFYGTDKEDSRLTQTFFIRRVDAQKLSVFPINRVKSVKI
jgi:hypothetical protein